MEEGTGRLEAIWIKRSKGGPMDPTPRATLVAGEGLRGNAHQGGWRQVTLIEREVFDRLQRELGTTIDPSMRRANLMVSGVRLEGSRHRVLRVGTCRIELRGETRPCERMDEAHDGLRSALAESWSGGAFGRVLEGGEIEVGDVVHLEPEPAAPEPVP